MDQLNQEKGDLDNQLSDSALYQDSEKEKLKQLLLRQGELQQQLGEVEERWMEVCEQLEEAQKED